MSLKVRSWSPYLVGVLIGLLSWWSFATADHPLGITTAFEYTGALLERGVAPEAAANNPYFAEQSSKGKSPKIDWEWMLVVGVFLGALISSKLSGDHPEGNPVPNLWAKRFGPSPALRLVVAFLAGAVMLLGARFAQGCTSGHGISGTLQLAVSSWVFAAVAFSIAVVTAQIMYKGVDHDGV